MSKNMYRRLFKVKNLYHSNLTYMEILYAVLTLNAIIQFWVGKKLSTLALYKQINFFLT